MPKIVDKEAKSKKIMAAALELFLEKGYKTVTTREIAKKAEVSKGVLYDYFENKQDLFYQTIQENMIKKVFYESVLHDKCTSPKERFQKLKELPCVQAHDQGRQLNMIFDFWVNCPDKKFKLEMLGEFIDVTNKTISEIISKAYPSLEGTMELKAVSNIIRSCLDGLAFQRMIEKNLDEVEYTLEFLWKSLVMVMENIEERAGA